MKMAAPKAISHISLARKRAIEWNVLRARVFKYKSSPADQRYFKIKIQEFVQGINPEKKDWYNFLFHMVWVRNDEGKTCKYCYYNEFLNRVYLDRNFEKWANATRDQIQKLLKQING